MTKYNSWNHFIFDSFLMSSDYQGQVENWVAYKEIIKMTDFICDDVFSFTSLRLHTTANKI